MNNQFNNYMYNENSYGTYENYQQYDEYNNQNNTNIPLNPMGDVSQPNFNFYGKNDLGKVAKINEDYFEAFTCANGKVQFLVVADGLGAKEGTDISSLVAVTEFKRYVSKYLLSDLTSEIEKVIEEGLYLTNRIIYNYSRINPELYSGFATTITIVAINGKKEMVVGHIGNTRLYMLREGELYQITTDDTIAQKEFEEGKIREEDLIMHPDRNTLTKALGAPNVDPFIRTATILSNDLLILMSNGVFQMLTKEQMRDIIINTNNSKEACENLIEGANQMGGVDNSVVLLSYINF